MFLWIQSLPIHKKWVWPLVLYSPVFMTRVKCLSEYDFTYCYSCAGPVFVVQWLFDEAQLTVDNIQLTGQPVQEGQWRYIQNLGIELRNTLKDVP